MEWKLIKNIDGFNIVKNKYIVSENGDIKNLTTGKIINGSTREDKYSTVLLRLEDGSRRNFYKHRIVYNLFIEQLKDTTKVVDHKDFNRSNNNYKNLQLITQKENIKRTVVNGRFYQLSLNNKLNDSLVESICQMLEKNMGNKDILKNIGLEYNRKNCDIITKIRTGKNWTHISSKYNFGYKKRSCMNSLSHLQNTVEKMIIEGKTTIEIANILGVGNDRLERQRFWAYIKRMRRNIIIINTDHLKITSCSTTRES